MRAAWLLAVVVVALSARSGAQNLPTALPFLEIPPSPSLNAMGSPGVARTDADPYGFLANPARLGLAARDARAATALYPVGASDWFDADLSLASAALTAGFDLRPRGLPVSLGVGLGETALRFGELTVVSETGLAQASYEPVDRYRALALGAATTGSVRVGLGGTARHVTSTDRAEFVEGRAEVSSLYGFTFDLGLLAEADVAALLGRPRLGSVRLALSLATGYAQTHIGGTVRYSGFTTRLALPRTATLGWSGTAGLDLPTAHGAWRLVEADVAVQAEHSLVREPEEGRYHYARTLGDLAVRDALFGRGSDAVTGRHGLRVTLAQTVALSRGGFDGWGFDDVRTRGFEFHLAGPLRAVSWATGDGRFAALTERFDLRFAHAVYFDGDLHESTFDGLTLVVRR